MLSFSAYQNNYQNSSREHISMVCVSFFQSEKKKENKKKKPPKNKNVFDE